jgi:hypothetical protein
MARRKDLNAKQIFELEEGLEKCGGSTIEEELDSPKWLLWFIVKKSHPLRLHNIDIDYWSLKCECDYGNMDLCYHCFLSYFIDQESLEYLKSNNLNAKQIFELEEGLKKWGVSPFCIYSTFEEEEKE